jgi:hypothetical protein
MKSALIIPTFLAAAGIALAVGEMPARAFNIGMVRVTNDTPDNVAGQIAISVVDSGNGTVEFNFTNIGAIASSITDIYFGKATTVSNMLGNITAIVNNSGVSFSENSTSLQSPTGKFAWSSRVKANADSPVSINGIDLNETLAIQFNTTASFQSIQDAFLRDQSLAIAMQVQNIGPTGGSDWFGSNLNVEPAPEPLTILGTGIAFGFGGLLKREYNRKNSRTKTKAKPKD